MHVAEEQDLLAQREAMLATMPAHVEDKDDADPLRRLWRKHRADFRDWQRDMALARKLPRIGTQTMEVMKEGWQFLEGMEMPDLPPGLPPDPVKVRTRPRSRPPPPRADVSSCWSPLLLPILGRSARLTLRYRHHALLPSLLASA